MRGLLNPEELSAALNDDFFANYEAQFADIDIQEQAKAALSGILTVETEDGTHRSYEQIKVETEAFFSNELVQANMQMLDNLAIQYAQFCAGHQHGAETMNDGMLGGVKDRGNSLLASQVDSHDHKHDAKTDNKKEEKDKKKKDKKKKVAGMLGLLFSGNWRGLLASH